MLKEKDVLFLDKYIDSSEYIWEVRLNSEGRKVIECDDIYEQQDLFPKLHECTKLN